LAEVEKVLTLKFNKDVDGFYLYHAICTLMDKYKDDVFYNDNYVKDGTIEVFQSLNTDSDDIIHKMDERNEKCCNTKVSAEEYYTKQGLEAVDNYIDKMLDINPESSTITTMDTVEKIYLIKCLLIDIDHYRDHPNRRLMLAKTLCNEVNSYMKEKYSDYVPPQELEGYDALSTITIDKYINIINDTSYSYEEKNKLTMNYFAHEFPKGYYGLSNKTNDRLYDKSNEFQKLAIMFLKDPKYIFSDITGSKVNKEENEDETE
jgi:hypothetical protein